MAHSRAATGRQPSSPRGCLRLRVLVPLILKSILRLTLTIVRAGRGGIAGNGGDSDKVVLLTKYFVPPSTASDFKTKCACLPHIKALLSRAIVLSRFACAHRLCTQLMCTLMHMLTCSVGLRGPTGL